MAERTINTCFEKKRESVSRKKLFRLGLIFLIAGILTLLYLHMTFELINDSGHGVYSYKWTAPLLYLCYPILLLYSAIGWDLDHIHGSRLLVLISAVALACLYCAGYCFYYLRRYTTADRTHITSRSLRLNILGCTIAVSLAFATSFAIFRYQPIIKTIFVELWLHDVLKELEYFSPDDSTPRFKVETQAGSRNVSLQSGTSGLVPLSDGKWVYIRAYSSHGSGDLVLALTSEGDLYACNAHVCPHLFIRLRNPFEGSTGITLDDFLDSTVSLEYGSKGSPRWQCVNDWKPREFYTVSFNTSAELLSAAKAISRSDTDTTIAKVLGRSNWTSSNGKGYSQTWKVEDTELRVHFTFENTVTAVDYSENGKTITLLSFRPEP